MFRPWLPCRALRRLVFRACYKLGCVRQGKTLSVLVLVVLLAAGCGYASAQQEPPPEQPNVVYVFTDDNNRQTLLRAMPNTRALIGKAGARFDNATFAHSLCCPNRVSMQRGQYPHNTGVWGNESPNGGFETFRERGLHLDTYATTFDRQGYRTGYFGKYLNGYGSGNLGFVPPGWDTWFSGAPMGKQYSMNGNVREGDYEREIFDKLVSEKAFPWIKDAADGGEPFLAVLSYYAPHSPAEHPASYDALYGDEQLPKPLSFDEEDVSDKPGWMQGLSRIGSQEEATLTQQHRDRLRSVRYVDKQIGRLIDLLKTEGELDNTYVVFWNDNGYHLGQHRLPYQDIGGKVTPYIEDVRFPLYVRGPDIAPGTIRSELVNTVDLRPTLEDMIGASSATPDYVDGESFLPMAEGRTIPWRTYGYSEALKDPADEATRAEPSRGPWRAVYSTSTAYHEWFSGEEEFYDLENDIHELDGTVSAEERPLLDEHRAALAEYRTCAGETCRSAGF